MPVAAHSSFLPDVIKIGYLTPLSGSASESGRGMRLGAELAEWVINERWGGIPRDGLPNATIDILITDTVTNPTATMAVATNLIRNEGVEVIIGAAISSNTLAAANITNPAQVVLISYASTSSSLTTQGGEYTFRIVGSDSLQGWALADTALNKGYKRALALYQDTHYGLDVAVAFKHKFEGKSGTVVEEIAYPETTTNFSAQLQTIHTLEDIGAIDVIMDVSWFADGAILFTEAASSGITTPWLCAETVADPFIFTIRPNVGPSMEGFWGITSMRPDPTTPAYQQFLAFFQERFPGVSVPFYADYSYDAIMLAVDAIRHAGVYEGSVIKEILPVISQEWIGATGKKTFDRNGDIWQEYRIWEVTESVPNSYEFATRGSWLSPSPSIEFDTSPRGELVDLELLRGLIIYGGFGGLAFGLGVFLMMLSRRKTPNQRP
jgi:branched-chain amino acid transport system substrate-binding protein